MNPSAKINPAGRRRISRLPEIGEKLPGENADINFLIGGLLLLHLPGEGGLPPANSSPVRAKGKAAEETARQREVNP